MKRSSLVARIKAKSSFLCVGLDSDIDKLPQSVRKSNRPVLEFNKRIIEYTSQHCVAYKLNTAFYECRGVEGWKDMEDTLAFIGHDHFVIADAKRGDIGNTSNMYAKAFLENLDFDAITVSPYMGRDSIEPFKNIKGKWVIILALTSNSGSLDFQKKKIVENGFLYEEVLQNTASYCSSEDTMYVIGATRSEDMAHVRSIIPDHFLLVPGVGAQGGSLEDVVKYGLIEDIGLLVNSSRGIIFASSGDDYASSAGREAMSIAQKMNDLLQSRLNGNNF